MTISSTAQAVLLLTAHFKTSDAGAAKPLVPKEYGRFAGWLHQRSLSPAHLLRGALDDLLSEWHDKTVSIERIKALLDRGPALAIAMERWLRSGLWVMTRSDQDYPWRLKQRLGSDSPAALFGCGNRVLLNSGGLAVVGSRNVKDADLAYSRKLGALASLAGVSIVSGGARGVDETAMLGALGAEGTAVGVLADSLLRACSGAKYREHLMANNLVLVSPFNPEAGFNTGNAMARNKYIYCLSDAALAVHSGTKGGTWTGAQEVLKKAWVPLWVKPTDDPEAGNAALIAAGALKAPATIDRVDVPAFFTVNKGLPTEQPKLAATEATVKRSEDFVKPVGELGGGNQAQSEPERVADDKGTVIEPKPACVSAPPRTSGLSDITFYDLFVVKARELCEEKPCTAEDLVDALELNKTQLNTWLKQAVDRGELRKLAKPVRYQVPRNTQGVLMLS